MIKYTALLALAVVIITIYSGLYLLKTNEDPSKAKIRKALKMNLFTFVPIMMMIVVLLIPSGSKAAETAATAAASDGLKYIGAALSTGLAAIGTEIGRASCRERV